VLISSAQSFCLYCFKNFDLKRIAFVSPFSFPFSPFEALLTYSEPFRLVRQSKTSFICSVERFFFQPFAQKVREISFLGPGD